jgi:phosphatidyl-myo-inositol dimannoside synthase
MDKQNTLTSNDRIAALFPELLGVGGIQEAGRLTAAALAQIAASRGWDTDFLSLNDAPRTGTVSCNDRNVEFRGFSRSKGRFILAAMASARKQTRVALAMHPHLARVAAQMKRLQPQLQMAVMSHGVEVWKPLSTFPRKAFLKADLFIAPSTYTLEKVIEVQGAARAKTKHIPWPLNPDFLEMAEKPESLPVPPDFPKGLVVMAAARLAADERYKGVDQLIRAVAQLAPKIPSLHLVVVGNGDDLPRHERMARELGVSGRLRFFQGLSPTEIAGCYSQCDVFALPSTGEGFGFVFLEAMAFGKPVIGAAAGGVTDIVQHGQNGLLVLTRQSGQLAQSLELLLTNKSLRVELGQKGADIVRLKYRFDGFLSELEHLLCDCGLQSERGRPHP